MKNKVLALSMPVGLLMELFYSVCNRFFIKFPDVIAYPYLIISISLMLVGLAYHGYCFGKHRNPYNFRH